MPETSKEELERRSVIVYKAFIKSHEKYVSWAGDETKLVSESEIKSKNSGKIREIQSLAPDKISIEVNEDCFKYGKVSPKERPADCNERYYTAMLGLTTYIALCRFRENVKKNRDIVAKYGITFSLEQGELKGDSTAYGLYIPPNREIHYSVSKCLYEWYLKWTKKGQTAHKIWITHVVDHEFGHYLAHMQELSLDEVNKKEPYAVKFKLGKGKFFDDFQGVLKEIEQMLTNMSDKKGDGKQRFIEYMKDKLKRFSDALEVQMMAVEVRRRIMPEREALKQMYEKIKTLNVRLMPINGASKYVDSYEKQLQQQDDLSTVIGERWLKEMYAEARAKSRGRIYDEIKKNTGNKLKSDKDWSDLCAKATYTGPDKERQLMARFANGYIEKLTKGRGIWGLAYRLLHLDKINLSSAVALEKSTHEKVMRALVKTRTENVMELLKKIKERLKQYSDIDDIIKDGYINSWLQEIRNSSIDFYVRYCKLMGYQLPSSANKTYR